VVTIIACSMRPSFMKNVFENYLRQTVEEKEMIVVLNKDDMHLAKWRRRAKKYPNVRVFKVKEKFHLGKCLNFAIRKAKYDIIAKFDDDDYYGPDYLKESLKAMTEKDAPIVGKRTSYLYFEGKRALMIYRRGSERKFVSKVKGGTLVFLKSVWRKVKFPEKRRAGSDARFLLNCNKAGFRVYSVSRANYVCIRRKDTGSHTQRKPTSAYMRSCKLIRRTSNFIPRVTKAIE
jgi:cellulose synthase/poly-beta-1,6-N-acetylglucosamine synthase-like glycosyltransferase